MNDGRQVGSGSAAAVVAVLLVLLPLLYVLSLGPAALITEKLGADKGPVKAFYAPVIWLHDHTPLEKPLEWYLQLWGVK